LQLAEATHIASRRRDPRLSHRVAVCTAILALLFAVAPAVARADGDPASDVLVTQQLFLPWDARVPTAEQARLQGMLQAAADRGYQIRVALIASASDLGSVTELWRQPQNYAEFLGQELSLLYHGRVLVVMPDGIGLYRAGGLLAAERAALGRTAPPTATTGLATAASDVVGTLAAAAGHALPTTSATPQSSRAPGPPAGSGDVGSWIVFLLGGGLVAIAWTASLRARPLRLSSKEVSPS
jgi:hypothetical protein